MVQGPFKSRALPNEAEIDREEKQPLDGCPECGGAVSDVTEHEHIEVDIPPVKPVITRYRTQSGWCGCCEKRVRSRHPDQISQATGAAGVVIGPRAKALAADLKHHMGVSYGRISDLFETVFGLSVARSTWCQAESKLVARAQPVYEQLIADICKSAAVHVDETGWRIGTLSAWLWVFCNAEITVYSIRSGEGARGHGVVLEILGDAFEGVLVSDRFSAYDAKALDQWVKQKCLSHLLRNLSDLSQSRQSEHVAFAETVSQVLRDALVLAKQVDGLDAQDYAKAAAAIEKRFDEALSSQPREPVYDHAARMARGLDKQRQHLFRFLYTEGLDATNNQAECDLRPAVITRKVGGCNRSDAGADNHAVLASILTTCRKQRVPVLDLLVAIQRGTACPSSLTPAPT